MDVADEATLARDLARWCIKVSNTMLKNKDQKRAKVIIRGADGECYDLRIKRLGVQIINNSAPMKEKAVEWPPLPETTWDLDQWLADYTG